jgi:hypothetical protein
MEKTLRVINEITRQGIISAYAIGGGIAARIFRQKRARRAQLAGLPFEKKIEIVVELQKMAKGIGKNARRAVWPI